MNNMTAIILGGGRGSRLEPLTNMRAKPAVPIGGKFRLIDIPISNCLHSKIRHMFILTQFNTESLHRHIHNSYRFDNFSKGYIRILAAQQTAANQDWYQGTADAVRKNLQYFEDDENEHFIILSGDHLYRMDYREFFNYHVQTDSDITIAVKPIFEEEASEFGILQTQNNGRITAFYEKPQDKKILDEYRTDKQLFDFHKIDPKGRTHVASMGIYIFKKKALFDALNDNDLQDFGREILPNSIESLNVSAYFFDGYWEDIGSIRTFFHAHLDLTKPIPPFNFYDGKFPFYTRPRYLPASKISNCHINQSIVAEGSIILGSIIEQAVIGIRAFIDEGTLIQRAIIMGNARYESLDDKYLNRDKSLPNLGIGKNCVIKNSIIDMNTCIGDNVQLINKDNILEHKEENYMIRDGIIIIPKGAVIPSNTVI